MSYCKVLMGGKERGLKYNQIAILEIGERNGKNKFEPGSMQHETYATASIIFAGLKGNSYAKDIEEDFSWEDATEWAEIIGTETKIIIIDALKASEKYKETVSYSEQMKDAEKKSKKKSPMKNTGRKV